MRRIVPILCANVPLQLGRSFVLTNAAALAPREVVAPATILAVTRLSNNALIRSAYWQVFNGVGGKYTDKHSTNPAPWFNKRCGE